MAGSIHTYVHKDLASSDHPPVVPALTTSNFTLPIPNLDGTTGGELDAICFISSGKPLYTRTGTHVRHHNTKFLYLLTAIQMFTSKSWSSFTHRQLPWWTQLQESHSWKTSGPQNFKKTPVTHHRDQLPSTESQSSSPTGQCWLSHQDILLNGHQQRYWRISLHNPHCDPLSPFTELLESHQDPQLH